MLKAGYSELKINPKLGIPIAGYFIERNAKGFLDDLYVCAMTLKNNDETFICVNVDTCGIKKPIIDQIIDGISNAINVSKDCIFVSATHSHTTPMLYPDIEEGYLENDLIKKYTKLVINKCIKVAVKSFKNLKPAKIGYAKVQAPDKVAYIRRYKMKDGSTYTCPPINDENILYPLGELDQSINVLRIDIENKKSIVILNYGLHADTINGELIASDWVGWVRKTISKILNKTKVLCLIGAEGDVGSTNVHPSGGDMNDTEISFDNEMKSPGMARWVGRALAGSIIQVFDKVCYFDVDSIKTVKKRIDLNSNMPSKDELPLAHKYKELHESGRDDQIPFKAMQLTTVVAEALRMCNLENGPEKISFDLYGVKIGNVALLGIPGEPFTDIGVRLKTEKGWDMILPCALTNGYEGYFPTKSAYEEGGYESRSSIYRCGVDDDIVNCCKEILQELKNK